MKLHTLFIMLLSVLILSLNGCGGGSSSTSIPADPTNPTNPTNPIEPTEPTTVNPEVTITDDYQVESLGMANTINATVSLGSTPKDLYLVLSNYTTTSASSTITHNAKMTEVRAQSKSILPGNFTESPLILRAPKYVQDFKAKINTLLSKTDEDKPHAKTIVVTERRKDIAGESRAFYLDTDGRQTTTATARKVISNITTNLGTKTLNIWIEDDSFDNGSGCSKTRCVTQTMVDQLANTFLMNGLDNDIYDWITNIYGEEWENNTNGYPSLITANNEITILLTDIDKDNSHDGGVIGYFWSKDNFIKSSINGSNERIMFYIDSVMFANGEDGWDIDDFWPKEMVSTLAHEFQHMIHFYQKTILLTSASESSTDIWIEEMLSETTEDLIATKIKHIGSRGVDYTNGRAGETGNTDGRYPLFNENNTLSLTAWYNRLEDYSKVNAFGTYLIRNYGGAKLLHDIMHNTYVDEQAIVDAVNKSENGSGKTFNNLLSEWGIAVMLSDHDNLGDVPFYNTGDFTYSTYNGITNSTTNGTTYDMGSINFFNYNPLPTIHTTAGTISAQGNYYYKIGDNLTGDINISLELNGQTEVTLIAK